MGIGIESFRQVSSGLLDREIRMNQDGEGVRKSGLSRLVSRFQGWISGGHQNHEQRVQERIQVKQTFVKLLEKTEGKEGAQRALGAMGLPKGWERDDRPLTNRMVGKILDKAQEFRMGIVKNNEKLLDQAIQGLEGPENRDLRNAICRAVHNDPRYGSEKLNSSDIQALRTQAEGELKELRAGQCRERFPGLSQLVDNAPEGSRLHGLSLDTRTLTGEVQQIFGDGHLEHVGTVLQKLDSTTTLLGQNAWSQEALAGLHTALEHQVGDLSSLSLDVLVKELEAGQLVDELETRRDDVQVRLDQARQDGDDNEVRNLETELSIVNPSLQSARNDHVLYQALGRDIDHQVELLRGKQAFVEEMRLTDPLSDRSIKHSNLVWTQAGNALINQLIEQANREDNPLGLTENQKMRLLNVSIDWALRVFQARQDYRETQNTQNLQTIPAPSKDNQDTHPIVLGKQETLDTLRELLSNPDLGLDGQVIDQLFSKPSLGQAERRALSGIETWQPITKDMVVMRDGVARTYQSKITPAQFLDRSLGVDLGGGRIGGTSAGVKDGIGHARNLKFSELVDSNGKVMTTVVGHGVLDMWDVEDEGLRQQTNQQGAKEVLEVALSTNPRLREALLDPNRDPGEKPPRLVHVSVNLISPDSFRETLLMQKFAPDYQERTYTYNQFRAFESNSGPEQELRVFNPNQPGGESQDTAKVDVDTITFSFGINGISTGFLQHVFGTWSNVHEHNTRNMVKLVGDLGEGEFGAKGTRPGGFVGEVYDRLETSLSDPEITPEKRQETEKLMGQLRGQTDLVRTMFTEETFRTGNGDTAKMGREILVLQGLAEQGLDLVGAKDLGGTMSKGCKSDKDRGGVTDVELKNKLILRDLGGEVNPDERLEGDDQGVYYTVSSSSGQLENQRWNTGLSGSKEAGKLKDRIPDPEVRQFLSGLGKFAKA